MISKKTTQELLSESLHELACAKPVDKISVKEIAQNCGMTTATFYRYFRDKYDLLAWIMNAQIEENMLRYVNGLISWRDSIGAVIFILWNDQKFYHNALSNAVGQNSFFASTHNNSVRIISDILRKKAGEAATEELLFFLEFYLRGASLTITEWVFGGFQLPPDVLTDRICQLTPSALQPYLK